MFNLIKKIKDLIENKNNKKIITINEQNIEKNTTNFTPIPLKIPNIFDEHTKIIGEGPYSRVREDFFLTEYPKHYNETLVKIKKSLHKKCCLNCGSEIETKFSLDEEKEKLEINISCKNNDCPGFLSVKTNILEMTGVTGAYGYDLDKIVVSKTKPTVILG